MADIYKQPRSKNYYMRFTDEHGTLCRRTTGTADKSAARAVLAREERAVELRRLGIAAPSPKQSRTPISRVIDMHLAECLERGNSPRWVDDKRWRLAKLVAWTGIDSIGELTPELIRAVLEEHLADAARSTRSAYLSIIRELCAWAIEQRPPMLAANPALGIMPRKRTRRAMNLDTTDKRRCLWTPEIGMLLAAEPEEPRMRMDWHRRRRPLYIVAMGTGLRRSTLSRIEPRMIKLDVANPHIAVPGALLKSGRNLVMPLRDASVIASIETLLAVCSARKPRSHGRDNPLIDRPFAPVPLSHTTFRQDIKRAGIPRVDEQGRRVVFHSLRATFATQLAINGVPPQVAMVLMDHTNIKTTLHYYTMVGVTDTTMFMDRMPAVDQAFDSAQAGMFESMLG